MFKLTLICALLAQVVLKARLGILTPGLVKATAVHA